MQMLFGCFNFSVISTTWPPLIKTELLAFRPYYFLPKNEKFSQLFEYILNTGKLRLTRLRIVACYLGCSLRNRLSRFVRISVISASDKDSSILEMKSPSEIKLWGFLPRCTRRPDPPKVHDLQSRRHISPTFLHSHPNRKRCFELCPQPWSL